MVVPVSLISKDSCIRCAIYTCLMHVCTCLPFVLTFLRVCEGSMFVLAANYIACYQPGEIFCPFLTSLILRSNVLRPSFPPFHMFFVSPGRMPASTSHVDVSLQWLLAKCTVSVVAWKHVWHIYQQHPQAIFSFTENGEIDIERERKRENQKQELKPPEIAW